MWCQCHWRTTILVNLKHRNSLHYSHCCNTFVRRGLAKSAGHPAACSVLATRLFEMHRIASADDLRDWMVGRARQLAAAGQKMLFPSMKRRHIDQASTDLAWQLREQKDRLQQQCDQLREELREARLQLGKSQTSTQGLLLAVKHWHSQYADLLDKYEDPDAGYGKPEKKRKISNEFELCL